jgi:Mg-chelatase subunit ChlD
VGYSTNSKDFLAHNYQYESSLGGDNDRVFKTAVKVEKGGNLFIRIMGDPLTHGFVEIMAKYLQANRNKLQEISQARLGRHGKLNYQLLTTAKA